MHPLLHGRFVPGHRTGGRRLQPENHNHDRAARQPPVHRHPIPGLFGTFESIQYQAVKRVTGRRQKQPPEMRSTASAHCHLPAVPRKPSEFIRRRAAVAAAEGRSETPDLEDDPVGVGKGVLVRARHLDTFGRPGDGTVAVPAKDQLLVFVRGLVFRGFLWPIPGRSTAFVFAGDSVAVPADSHGRRCCR